MVLHDPVALRAMCDHARSEGRRVGFVPTMGALHDGHLALVREARSRATFVVVSVFVNPTQFGPAEDFSRYPRTLESDCARCAEALVDVVFAPEKDVIYAPGDETRVRVGDTAAALCGAHRPGHFEGVCTVVAKLFALVGPAVAVFGRKDYQQYRVIDRMTRDLAMPIEVVGLRTVREPDGLALSSRNAYLSAGERTRALGLARGLSHAVRAFESGARNAGHLRSLVLAEVTRAATLIDYVTVADPDTVRPIFDADCIGERALVAVAARIGATRLIDNVVLGEDPAPIEVCA
ncbi:MAG: pantoate--beta-alanine ligase [Myxococcales bacterium]|nr:pantoate--beta-alanine ligase [Myxococcales bacterium]